MRAETLLASDALYFVTRISLRRKVQYMAEADFILKYQYSEAEIRVSKETLRHQTVNTETWKAA